jgi:CRISPR/Cas system CMR-associated protein Cmr3 (group 5 of RAMP superfamily)
MNGNRSVHVSRNLQQNRPRSTKEALYFLEIYNYDDECYIALTEEQMLELFTAFVAVKQSYTDLAEDEN